MKYSDTDLLIDDEKPSVHMGRKSTMRLSEGKSKKVLDELDIIHQSIHDKK